MDNYITTDWLNLRSAPSIPTDSTPNILGVLPPDTVVEKTEDSNDVKWFHIKAYLSNQLTEGYAASNYLQKTEQVINPVSVSKKITAVHLPLVNGPSRSNINYRAYPLNEQGQIKSNILQIAASADRINFIYRVIEWLDVEKSARYAPTSLNTYCNIYAYDVCYCLGLYVPRVWWTGKALAQFELGEIPKVIYGNTVRELNANSLADWMDEYGDSFAWKRVTDINDLQVMVNTGTLGIIVAQRINLNRSGHIIAVLPESDNHQAYRNGQVITSPLQSQAGSKNKKYFTNLNWWLNPNKFRKFSFWFHE